MESNEEFGRLTVYAGCMKSGKSDLLANDLITVGHGANAERPTFRIKPVAFQHELDVNASSGHIASRTGARYPSVLVHHSSEILERLPHGATHVGIDEVQFFDTGLREVVWELMSRNMRVMAAGLDLDFLRRPFPVMAELMCLANKVEKRYAACSTCGRRARFTQKLVNGLPAPRSSERVQAKGDYLPRCGKHHVIPKE